MDNLGVKQRCFFARLWSFLAVFNWCQTQQGCHHSSTTRCVSMLFNLFQGTPFRKAIALLISFNAALLGHFMAEMSKAPVKPVSAPEGRAGWWQFATTMALTGHQIASNSPELYQSTSTSHYHITDLLVGGADMCRQANLFSGGFGVNDDQHFTEIDQTISTSPWNLAKHGTNGDFAKPYQTISKASKPPFYRVQIECWNCFWVFDPHRFVCRLLAESSHLLMTKWLIAK